MGGAHMFHLFLGWRLHVSLFVGWRLGCPPTYETSLILGETLFFLCFTAFHKLRDIRHFVGHTPVLWVWGVHPL